MSAFRISSAALAASISLLAGNLASAHIGYSGRNFGIFSGLVDGSVTIVNQQVAGNFGWADGTDDDFSDSHNLRAFRFTLENTAWVTVSVNASTFGTGGNTVLGDLLPAFSIYSGLAHLSPHLADHDGSDITVAYLATLPGPPKEGAFYALADFKIGNDPGSLPAELTHFTYMGHAADGTSANYGPAPGINGDGNADGFVTGTWQLGPGDYTIFIGGADYAAQLATPSNTARGIAATVAVSPVPEPSSALMLASAATAIGLMRRRR